MTFSQFMYVLAFVLFILAGVGVPSGRWNLIGFGLAALSAAALFGSGGFSFGN